MNRRPEPEYMDDPAEAAAYAGADFSEVNAAFVSRLIELTDSRDRADAIDLGTGPGDIAIRVARARPHWKIIGVDAAEAMLAIARKAASGISNLTFQIGDAKNTGLPDRSCDVIFSNSLLHHLPDPLPMWRQIVRLARPGAILFLRDLLRPASHDASRSIVQTYAGNESPLLQEEFHRSLLAAFTIEEIRQQLADCGLGSILRVQPASDRHVDVLGVFPAN